MVRGTEKWEGFKDLLDNVKEHLGIGIIHISI